MALSRVVSEISKMSWLWNWGQRSLRLIESSYHSADRLWFPISVLYVHHCSGLSSPKWPILCRVGR